MNADVKYLVDLLEKFDLDFYDVMDVVECHFGADRKTDFNMIMYEVLNEIAHKFIYDNQDLFESTSNEFNIFCNRMDSHIYFKEDEVQCKFEGYF